MPSLHASESCTAVLSHVPAHLVLTTAHFAAVAVDMWARAAVRHSVRL